MQNLNLNIQGKRKKTENPIQGFNCYPLDETTTNVTKIKEIHGLFETIQRRVTKISGSTNSPTFLEFTIPWMQDDIHNKLLLIFITPKQIVFEPAF
jgi:hypothetical protein